MKYIAAVIEHGTSKVEIIEREYPTKKQFASDLRGNGYYVRFISTEEKFEEDCAKYHERLDAHRRMERIKRETNKMQAERMNMTVKEFEEWLRA